MKKKNDKDRFDFSLGCGLSARPSASCYRFYITLPLFLCKVSSICLICYDILYETSIKQSSEDERRDSTESNVGIHQPGDDG